ncbi:MAG: hypothetical protein JWR14_5221 [Caballeronia sp.]|jgi:hypothetical protein|uniref:hypothetical protein n=1 Tax=Caballeronia sp. TaxID=1931223 RepID=UPI002634B279|nr:hypothetical protein [Caballeronia sp.]MDB5835391.1 hypothetical protein [Caballeronia sp.]
MNTIDGIVQAVLYEGYMLYPYRASSVKNRQRWTFGSVYPQTWADWSGSDASMMQTECVIEGDDETRVTVRPCFLHLIERDVRELSEPVAAGTALDERSSQSVASLEVGGRRFDAWQEAGEQHVEVPALTLGELCIEGLRLPFSLVGSRAVEPLMETDGLVRGALVRTRAAIVGRVECCAMRIDERTFRLTVRIVNVTPVDEPQRLNRDAASSFALLSCHAVLAVEGAAFVSSIEPPDELAEAVAGCKNIGLWPVLVGSGERHDTMLAAPIILYDYPQVAPESAGDLFDATEIDEILTLRILTMTDAEKREMAAGDERSRALLERTESLSANDMQRLHGTLRDVRVGTGWPEGWRDVSEETGEAAEDTAPWAELDAKPRLACVNVDGVALQVGSRVVLHPHARADIFDLALRDQVATIESIERDFEDHVHVAVTIDCDPGRDFGLARMPGHRFFFSPDEMEPLREEGPS